MKTLALSILLTMPLAAGCDAKQPEPGHDDGAHEHAGEHQGVAAKPNAAPAAATAQPASPAATAAFDASMTGLLPDYLAISDALAADKTDGVAEAAGRLADKAAKVDATTVTGEHGAHYKDVPTKLAAAARRIADAKDIEAMRAGLKDASRPVAMWAEMSKQSDVNVVFCSMAGGSWLQKDKEVHNPYYGAKMPHCGELVSGPGKTAATN